MQCPACQSALRTVKVAEDVTIEVIDDLPPDVLRGDNHVAIYQADANQEGKERTS